MDAPGIYPQIKAIKARTDLSEYQKVLLIDRLRYEHAH